MVSLRKRIASERWRIILYIIMCVCVRQSMYAINTVLRICNCAVDFIV